MPHDLEHDDAAMCRSRIAQLVDGVDDRVGRRIAANRIVRTPDIIVDGARQADDRHARLLGEQRRATQGAVTTDDDEAFDAAVLQILIAELATLRRLPAFAASRAEEGTTALDDVANILGLHLEHILIQQAMIAIIDAPDLDPFEQCCTHNGTRCRVHARTISTAGHHGNTFQRHVEIPLAANTYSKVSQAKPAFTHVPLSYHKCGKEYSLSPRNPHGKIVHILSPLSIHPRIHQINLS